MLEPLIKQLAPYLGRVYMTRINIISLALAIIMNGLILHCVMAKEPYVECKREFLAIKIYFVHWDIITRVRLSPEDIRRMRKLYIEINDKTMISKTVDAIYHDKFHDRVNKLPEEARLVIDFIKKNGAIETVYANKSHVLTEDSSKSKDINNELLNKIGSIINLTPLVTEQHRKKATDLIK